MKYQETSQHRDFRFDPPKIQNPETDTVDLPPLVFKSEGKEIFNIEDVTVELVYETPSKDNVSPEEFAQLEKYRQIDNFRVVRFLKLSTAEKDIVLNITDLVPVGTNVLLDSSVTGIKRLNNYNSKHNTITIGMDLREIEGIATLLHEIGHARTRQLGEGGLEKEQLDEATFYRQFFKDGTEGVSEIPQAVLETILKDEWLGWKFAIKSLQPFLKSKDGSAFDETALKQYASEWLSTYFQKIPEQLKAKMVKLIFDAKSSLE